MWRDLGAASAPPGPLIDLEPRLKILVTLGYVLTVAALPPSFSTSLAVAAVVLAFVIGLAGIEPSWLFRRWLAILPVVGLFALMVARTHPLRAEWGYFPVALAFVGKNALAVLAVLTCAAVTPWVQWLRGLTRLGVPLILLSALAMMGRFAAILRDEATRMIQARRARTFCRAGLDWAMRAGLIAALLARALERGDRLHAALLARGYRGEPDAGLPLTDDPPPLGLPDCPLSFSHPPARPVPMNSVEVPPLVEVRALTYRYPDGRLALRDISFCIQPGETIALIGPNGAGKSTLLWHLNGLLPESIRSARDSIGDHSHSLELLGQFEWNENDPSNPVTDDAETNGNPGSSRKATIHVGGLPITPTNAREIRRRVGLLFQDPDDQLFGATVLDDVAYGPRQLGMKRREALEYARHCLALVGLNPSEYEDRPPHHLSFGEKKRAGLAGVLACRPDLLALDEPTANLDPRARRRLIEIVRSLSCGKLIATHDLDMAVELCDRVLLLDGGRLIAEGPTLEILARHDLLEAHGLETPPLLELRALRQRLKSE